MKSILIIEDEPEVATLLRTILKQQPVHVLEAFNGHEAIAVMQRELPDMILLDLAMPGFNGLDVLQTMSETPSLCDIPVLVVTARPQMAKIARRYGNVSAVFFKPTRPSELLSPIIALLTS